MTDDKQDKCLESAIAEYLRRQDRGEVVDRAQFLNAHPSCADELHEFFETMDQIEEIANNCVEEVLELPDSETPLMNAADNRDQWEGEVLPFPFGRYKVLQLLGRGGMGAVYLATDTRLDRLVALKIPQSGKQNKNQKAFERFVRESQTNVSHPNICTVYDSGIIGGLPFISMAYIQGQSLGAFTSPGNLAPHFELVSILCLVAEAMEAAHQAMIVHRDLKPGNIMVNELGHPFVMDFGLARRFDDDKPGLTSYGDIVGTPAYLSPEQLGATAAPVTFSSDIYSLGVTFYELLTGRQPFQGSLSQIVSQIMYAAPERPSRLVSDIDRGLERICLQMMAKRPIDRQASMREVSDELRLWLKQNSAKSETAEELQHLRKQIKLMNVTLFSAVGGIGILELAKLLTTDSESHAHSSREEILADDLSAHARDHDTGWHSPFETILEGHSPIERADHHFGTPEHDRAFWEGQQSHADTCAIRCQEYILQQFTGINFPENFLVNEAKQHGWYEPGHGTSMQDVGNLLELHGVAVNRFVDANVFNLANELSLGHKVIIGVDSGVLWGHNSTMDSLLDTIHRSLHLPSSADHAVVVSGIDTTDPYHPKVIISDPGDGKAVASYPLEQFLNAWEGSHFYMVATKEPAPPHLPEMVNFDYHAGHIGAIAGVPYQQFVDNFSHHVDTWEHVLEQFVGEHFFHPESHHDHSTHGDGHSNSDEHNDHHPGEYHDHHDAHHSGEDHHYDGFLDHQHDDTSHHHHNSDDDHFNWQS